MIPYVLLAMLLLIGSFFLGVFYGRKEGFLLGKMQGKNEAYDQIKSVL